MSKLGALALLALACWIAAGLLAWLIVAGVSYVVETAY